MIVTGTAVKRVFIVFFTFALVFSGMFLQVPNQASAATNQFRGVNWADERDNFVDGWVIPSGLAASDSYQTVRTKANRILTGFQNNLGANTVRLPINPSSVLDSWWTSYSGAIDEALALNMKVIVAYWEGASSRDGLVDNESQFWSMWQAVVSKYQNNSNVYFEIFNEPHGYSASAWANFAAQWLNAFPAVPRGRIMVSGSGYSEDMIAIGNDSRFSDCLLSMHIYAFWGTYTSEEQWRQLFRQRVGNHYNRTVVTEYGVPMTTGINYNGPINGDVNVAFMYAIPNQMREYGMGSVYWPGLRSGDSYTIQQLNGSGTNITLSTTNESGKFQIQWAWGMHGGNTPGFDPNAVYQVQNRKSGLLLDVNGGSTSTGATVIQWPDNGGTNQQWRIVSAGGDTFSIVNVKSGLLLDVNGGSSQEGASVIQWTSNGGANQRWRIIDIGGGFYDIVNVNSGLLLDVNGGSTSNGASVIQWSDNNGANQQWKITKL